MLDPAWINSETKQGGLLLSNQEAGKRRLLVFMCVFHEVMAKMYRL